MCLLSRKIYAIAVVAVCFICTGVFCAFKTIPIERNTLRTVINDGLPFSDKEV